MEKAMMEISNNLTKHTNSINSIKFDINNLVCELLRNKAYMKKTSDRSDPVSNVLLGIENHLAGNNEEANKCFKAASRAAKDDTRFLNEHECNLIYAMFLHCIDDYEAAQISVNVAQNLPDSYLANFYAGLYTLHGEMLDNFGNLVSELDEYKERTYDQEYFEEEIVPLMEEVEEVAALCEEYFSTAIKLNPDFAPAYFYRAFILDCQNKKSAADYKKAKELDEAFSVIIK
jgi:hypothetical protein